MYFRHLQVTAPSKNAHDNLKHNVIAYIGRERPQASNNIVHIRKYNRKYILETKGPAQLRSDDSTWTTPVNYVLPYDVALQYCQHFFII